MKNIIVIFGGISPEHDVSIVTGCLALNSLDRRLFTPIPIYVNKKGEWFTGDKLFKLRFFKEYSEKSLTRVNLVPGENILRKYASKKKLCVVKGAINCMHGGTGENGTIGALFELCGIPITSQGGFGAALSMDKALTKTFLKGLDVKTLPCETVYRGDFYKDTDYTVKTLADRLKLPLIVKPATCGSSIGISVAESYKKLYDALVYAFRYDDKVVAERYVEKFYEINCAAYRKNGETVVSRLEKPLYKHDILSFEDKYLLNLKSGIVNKEFPAKIPDYLRDEIYRITKLVYEKAALTSVVRIDYIVENDTVYLNEINAVPGSLAYYLFYDNMRGITDLLTDLLEETFKQSLSKKGNMTSYESDILSFKGVALKK